MNIYIEGNIGSGKSTFLKYLEENLPSDKFTFIYEPVDLWQEFKDEDGKNILDCFYQDSQKFAFPFQLNAFITRIQRIQECRDKNKINIIERSVFSDKHCFAKNLRQSKMLNSIEYKLYESWHSWLSKDVKADGFIYIRTQPEISLERINKRSRAEESSIPIDYLKDLHDSHETWLLHQDNVLLIESINNMYEKKEIMNKHVENIMKWFVGLNNVQT